MLHTIRLKRNKVFKDKDFMLAYKNKIQSLKQHYLEKVSISSVSEEIKRQNRLIAKEILLSIERYSPVTQFFYLNSLKDRFSEAYKKGLEMTEETIEKLYELITFRVIFKGVENEYFNALSNQEVQEFKQKNQELLKDQSENYEMIQDAFQNANVIGKLLQLTIKTSPNKKDPDHPYRNYKFDMAEQPKTAEVSDPFAATKDPQEISDSDLPFD